MVRVSQCILDKTLAVKSVRRYTSGDSGVEHEKLSQARGQMVRRHRDDEAEAECDGVY